MRYTEKWSSLVYQCVWEPSFGSSINVVRVFVFMLVDASKRRTFPFVWWIGVLKCVQCVCCFVWRVFDTFDMFVVCLARVWRVFGVLLAFVALFVSRKVFIVVGCVRLQWIAIDFKRLRFCRSVCRFLYRTRVDLVCVFASGLMYREVRGMCNDCGFCCTRVAVHRQHFYRWRIATNESSYRGLTSEITLDSWKWSTRAPTYMVVCMISVTVFPIDFF